MPGWYDITSFSALDRSSDEVGINKSIKYFHDLIDAEVNAGIPSERIVLGGFSQGGAMSLIAGPTYGKKLGGIFGLSAYMLMQDKFRSLAEESGGANKNTKIFMGHGDADQVVKHEYGLMTAERLKSWGYDVEFNTYP